MSFSHPIVRCDLDDGPAVQGSTSSNFYFCNMDLVQCLVVFNSGADRRGQLRGKISVVIIQQIVTLSKYGHDALDIRHP